MFHMERRSRNTLIIIIIIIIEVADQTFYLIQSYNTDTGPTSPGADPITLGTWQGRDWSANGEVTGMTRPGKRFTAHAGMEAWSAAQPVVWPELVGLLVA